MLRVERDGAIAIFTIARPEVKNALDRATMIALSDAVRDASLNASLRAAIVTGEGDAFVSGGDLRELRDQSSADDAERLSDAGFELCRALADLPFPVIAALSGAAIGGGAELAVACDLRVAHPSAKIAFKQVRLGVTTAWGTVPRLVALVGAGAAARLLYTAQEIGAAEARAIGLVDAVAPEGAGAAAAVDFALAWARDVARSSPRAVHEMKRIVRAATETSVDLRDLERELFVATWSGPDHAEAVEAFFARRAPAWNERRTAPAAAPPPRDFARISPSARSLLLVKSQTTLPYAKEAAALIFGRDAVEAAAREAATMPGAAVRRAHFEHRARSLDEALALVGATRVLEIASGLSFRGLAAAEREGVYYLDTDLPEVAEAKAAILAELQPAPLAGTLRVRALDALDAGAVRAAAAEMPPGPLAIVHEGLLMYLDGTEKARLAAIVRDTLRERGGAWITADVYVRSEAPMYRDERTKKFLAEHRVDENKFESFEAAEAFFVAEGFAVAKRLVPKDDPWPVRQTWVLELRG